MLNLLPPHNRLISSLTGLILCVTALGSFAQTPDSCTCIWQGSFDKIVARSDLIVSGKIITRKGNSMDFGIDRTLLDREKNGREYLQNIRIWGHDGKQCRPEVERFPIDSHWLLALNKITEDVPNGFNPNTPNISYGRNNDYFLSMCGAYWLQVHDDFATGNLVKGRRWEWENNAMNPVLIDLIDAYAKGSLPSRVLIEAAKPNSAARNLMKQTQLQLQE